MKEPLKLLILIFCISFAYFSDVVQSIVYRDCDPTQLAGGFSLISSPEIIGEMDSGAIGPSTGAACGGTGTALCTTKNSTIGFELSMTSIIDGGCYEVITPGVSCTVYATATARAHDQCGTGSQTSCGYSFFAMEYTLTFNPPSTTYIASRRQNALPYDVTYPFTWRNAGQRNRMYGSNLYVHSMWYTDNVLQGISRYEVCVGGPGGTCLNYLLCASCTHQADTGMRYQGILSVRNSGQADYILTSNPTATGGGDLMVWNANSPGTFKRWPFLQVMPACMVYLEDPEILVVGTADSQIHIYYTVNFRTTLNNVQVFEVPGLPIPSTACKFLKQHPQDPTVIYGLWDDLYTTTIKLSNITYLVESYDGPTSFVDRSTYFPEHQFSAYVDHDTDPITHPISYQSTIRITGWNQQILLIDTLNATFTASLKNGITSPTIIPGVVNYGYRSWPDLDPIYSTRESMTPNIEIDTNLFPGWPSNVYLSRNWQQDTTSWYIPIWSESFCGAGQDSSTTYPAVITTYDSVCDIDGGTDCLNCCDMDTCTLLSGGTFCGYEPPEQLCRDQYCNGISATCPAPTPKPALTLCAAATGCDNNRRCDGSSYLCPGNPKPYGTLCAAGSECLSASYCDGNSGPCPTQYFMEDKVACQSPGFNTTCPSSFNYIADISYQLSGYVVDGFYDGTVWYDSGTMNYEMAWAGRRYDDGDFLNGDIWFWPFTQSGFYDAAPVQPSAQTPPARMFIMNTNVLEPDKPTYSGAPRNYIPASTGEIQIMRWNPNTLTIDKTVELLIGSLGNRYDGHYSPEMNLTFVTSNGGAGITAVDMKAVIDFFDHIPSGTPAIYGYKYNSAEFFDAFGIDCIHLPSYNATDALCVVAGRNNNYLRVYQMHTSFMTLLTTISGLNQTKPVTINFSKNKSIPRFLVGYQDSLVVELFDFTNPTTPFSLGAYSMYIGDTQPYRGGNVKFFEDDSLQNDYAITTNQMGFVSLWCLDQSHDQMWLVDTVFDSNFFLLGTNYFTTADYARVPGEEISVIRGTYNTPPALNNTGAYIIGHLEFCGDGIITWPETCEPPDICCNVTTCQYKTAGTPCADATLCSDAAVCTGVNSTCIINYKEQGFVCDASLGPCETDGICNGLNSTCSAKEFKPPTFKCDNATDLCDSDSYCTGTNYTCPPIALKPNTTVCHNETACTDEAMCTGLSPVCTIVFKPNGTVCANTTAICQEAGTCNGISDTCSSVSFRPDTYLCRNSTQDCEEDTYCTGSDALCPAAPFTPNTTVCFNETLCAFESFCPGDNYNCAIDYKPDGTICDPSLGICETDGTCNGFNLTCSSKEFLPPTELCRNSTDLCEEDTFCTGSNYTCPISPFSPNTTLCQNETLCTEQSFCLGDNYTCPIYFKPPGTICDNTSAICEEPGTCNGVNDTCSAILFRPDTYLCRNSTQDCEEDTYCTGLAPLCPAAPFTPNTTVCFNETLCAFETFCPGDNYTCIIDHKPDGTICDPSLGICETDGTCNGFNLTCSSKEFLPPTELCRNSTDLCEEDTFCTGSNYTCPISPFSPNTTLCQNETLCTEQSFCLGDNYTCPIYYKDNGTICDDKTAICEEHGYCTGHNDTCLPRTYKPDTYLCRNATQDCEEDTYCTGSSITCPAAPFSNTSVSCFNETLCAFESFCPGDAYNCTIDYKPDGTVCDPSLGICETDGTCNGENLICSARTLRPPTFLCDPASDACQANAFCTNGNYTCPPKQIRPLGYKCANATVDCQSNSFCDGISIVCPANPIEPPGTPCGPQFPDTACVVSQTCNAFGECTGLNPKPAGTPCTIDDQTCGETTCDGAGVCRVSSTNGCVEPVLPKIPSGSEDDTLPLPNTDHPTYWILWSILVGLTVVFITGYLLWYPYGDSPVS